MNTFTAVGVLTKDATLEESKAGTKYCRFAILSNEGSTGSKCFMECVAFGKLGETIAQYKKNGDQVFISGHIESSEKEVEGIKMYVTRVVVEKCEFLRRE